MRRKTVISAVVGSALLLTAEICHPDPFTFQDNFEGYANDDELKAVWDADWDISLGSQGGNQYLQGEVSPAGKNIKLHVWTAPTGDLTGEDLSADIRCTEVNSGYAYFYIQESWNDYRSIIGYPLSTAMDWATFTLSNIGPEDFVTFWEGTETLDLTNAQRIGLTFWVNTHKLGTQYMEVDNFAVTPEPSTLLILGPPVLFLSRAILRRRKRRRHQPPV